MFQTLMIIEMDTAFLSIQKKFFFFKKEHDDESLNNTFSRRLTPT